MKKQVEILFCKGLPGSGKSTYSLEFCQKYPKWRRVNRDDIRASRGKYWIPEDEDYITSVERFMVKESLLNGFNVIVDAMNLNPKYMTAWNKWLIELMNIENIEIKISEKFFYTDVETCIERDAMRPPERRVGHKLIKDLYYKYIANVKYQDEDDFLKLPHAIICDIDGTIADANGRNHYDYTKVINDRGIPLIIGLVENYLSLNANGADSVLFISGRDDICEKDTRAWIFDHMQIKNDEFMLFMRKSGDRRKDSIVKREIFENYIRGNFYIDYCLDDRNQVVEMWRRELGLTVLQCAEGDF